MIFQTKPSDFNKKFDIASCFVLWQDKFLLLQRQEWKPQPKQRGPPAGKVSDNEMLEDAMLRELEEETGIVVKNEQINQKKSEKYQIKTTEKSDRQIGEIRKDSDKKNTTKSQSNEMFVVPSGAIAEYGEKECGEKNNIRKKDFLFGKLHTTFVRYPNYDFEYHEFILDKFINDEKPPKVILNKNEHCNHKRILPNEALTLDLMPDEDWFVRRFFGIEM